MQTAGDKGFSWSYRQLAKAISGKNVISCCYTNVYKIYRVLFRK